jgi:hypothetical protein
MYRAVNAKNMLGIGIGLLSLTAQAQVRSLKESTMSPTHIAVEVKPLPMMLSVIPGVTGVGIGTEFSSEGNATAFADVFSLYADLPSNLRREGNEQDRAVLHKIKGASVDVGGRYYSNHASAASWYGGARLSYSAAMSRWSYQGEQVNQTVRMISPGLEGGHRWNLMNNFLLRLGAGLDGNIISENTATAVGAETSVTRDGEDQVKRYAQMPVTPRADLGVGYIF